MENQSRRRFLKGAGATAAMGMAAGPKVSFALDDLSKSIMVYVFLRGGIDGLSLVTPMNGHPDRGNYDQLRVNGTNIPSSMLLPLSNNWGLHPAATGLQNLWNSNDLAIVQAVGLPIANRSHFEAERYVELGTPGNRFTPTGWLTRHLQTAVNLPQTIVLPAVVTETTVSFSLLREPSAVTMRFPSIFDLDSTSSGFEEEQETALADLYQLDSTELDVAGSQALSALELVEQIDFDNYTPANGAQYPTRLDDPGRLTGFAEELQIIAQLIKEDSGLRVAQSDRGGWDTHNQQGNLTPDGDFWDNVRDVSETLQAFYTDLNVPTGEGDNWSDRLTVVVYSEFGRRAFDNNDAGTDHGWGNNMFVLGGDVNGGQFYGTWPGLAEADLFQGADVFSTTDYRNVLSEILLKRFRNNKIVDIFPGFTEPEYNPLGVVNGSLVQPDFGDPDIIFRDNLE